jgi:hypothetical protein
MGHEAQGAKAFVRKAERASSEGVLVFAARVHPELRQLREEEGARLAPHRQDLPIKLREAVQNRQDREPAEAADAPGVLVEGSAQERSGRTGWQ